MRATDRRAYTLIELLVVIVILIILAALTVSAVRGFRSHQVLEQAAARVEMLVETARTAAVARGEPVYLALADVGTVPASLTHRALILLRDLDDPEALRDWQILPAGSRFDEDPQSAEGDLMAMEPYDILANLEVGLLSGPVRILLRINPDGRFQVGEGRRMESAHLTLLATDTLLGADGRLRLMEPLDAIRIHFRALTGTTRVERLLP